MNPRGIPSRSTSRSRLALLAGLAAACLGIASPAYADIFRVRNTADTGPDSLRRAITQANNNPAADDVRFRISGGGVKTITPDTPLPDITGPVTIDGLAAREAPT